MSEPDWKQELQAGIEAARIWRSGEAWGFADTEELTNAVLPHIEAAYQRGLQAGRSQAGYGTRRKSKKEPQCAPTAETPSRASSTEGEG